MHAGRSRAELAAASTAWQELYTASQRVGTSLGGVAASQEEIARAADRAAEKLNLAKGAIDFTREAAEAKRLRDAAEYVDVWTQALGRKEAAERAAGAADAEAALGTKALRRSLPKVGPGQP